MATDNGTIVSHAGVGMWNYDVSRSCYWHITVSSGKVVRAWFDFLSLLDGDFVRFFNGNDTSCSSQTQIAQTPLSCSSVVSESNTMSVYFYSDTYLSGLGFRLRFEAVDDRDGESE
jgi:hypothetical protein